MWIRQIVSAASLVCIIGCAPVGGPNSWIPKTIASLQGGGQKPGWGSSFQDWELHKRVVKKIEETLPDIAKKVDIYIKDKKILVVGVLLSHQQQEDLRLTISSAAPQHKIVDRTVFATSYPLRVRMKDSWLETKIESKLLVTAGVASYNYGAIVFNSEVELLGVAQSEEELQKVVDIIKSTDGVKEVHSFVRVTEDQVQKHEDKKSCLCVRCEMARSVARAVKKETTEIIHNAADTPVSPLQKKEGVAVSKPKVQAQKKKPQPQPQSKSASYKVVAADSFHKAPQGQVTEVIEMPDDDDDDE